ncbi:MAG: methylated-DNA--[protein]-cysteine S-methyltransferase [Propionibacteriaceae bacterium]|jgi:AraC family transcriptional regulator of adaptative response/methylated-DNA-[protein]-cysteine methyltransferase|nr:methylated-DNA--[protein]-cysteine S-methyltransferase [Propionibacteriaceae bacterium]
MDMRLDDDTRWQAVVDCRPEFDGAFYYVVTTVGVCCRPSCRSRRPRRENVIYFDSLADAQRAGYRPCRRCRPDQPAVDPAAQLVAWAKQQIESRQAESHPLAGVAAAAGVSPGHLARLFQERVGCSPVEHLNRVRAHRAGRLLDRGQPIAEVASAVGFDALGGFYRMFKQQTGHTPQAHRGRTAAGLARARYESPIGPLTVLADGAAVVRLLLPGEVWDESDPAPGPRPPEPVADHPTEPVAVRPAAPDQMAERRTDADDPDGDTKQPRHTGDPTTERRTEADDLLARAVAQLDEYFSGRRRRFDLPLALHGTAFQRTVWEALIEIPYATTASYTDVAVGAGRPRAVRAVGQANNRNPIPIIVPCHRVIGHGGALTGYRGGLEAKHWLLEHERTHA